MIFTASKDPASIDSKGLKAKVAPQNISIIPEALKMDVLLTDSEWESSSESGSSEETDFLYGGQACTILSSLEESIGKIDDFLSFEREVIHGDIVRSATDPCGQMGRVTNINMFVDLENVHGKTIKDINSKQLLRIRSISVGDYVVNESWIGRVDKVVDRVSIVFDDGSKCEVTAMDYEKLVPVSPNIIDDSQYPFYPGQRVQVVASNVSRSTRWLCGAWRDNQDEGTVSDVDAGFVYVDWISSAHLDHSLSASPPSSLQEVKDLTLLSCFSHANWQLGDWCMLPFAYDKGTNEKFLHESSQDIIKGNWKLEKGFKRGNLGSRLEEIFVIIKTRTKVDVVWQDGTCGLGLDLQNLLPVGVANAHEFWPNQFVLFVLEKGTSGNSQRWGVVHTVDAKEQTVNVQWKNMAVNQGNDFDGEQMEETVSAYELVEHPDYSYSFGDIVFKVVQNQFSDQADKGHVISKTGFGTDAALKEENYSWDQNKYPSTYYLSCIGIVIGFKDGDVEVKWASGIPSKVAPYEIYRIDKDEVSATTSVLYEENTKDFNQEMFVHETQSNSHKGKNLLNFGGADGSGKKFSWTPPSFFCPLAAIGFISSIASSILGSRSLLSQESSSCISPDAKEYDILHEEEPLETCNDCAEQDQNEMQLFETTYIKQEVTEIEENDGSIMLRPGKTSDRFKQFDMVSDCSDHHFLGESKVLAVSQVKRSWLKKVQQEWSILEKNLPETIYVRVYEERMDLLRAALVGAPGTPYHDGLFFFDIFLPSEYPYEPPLVHYQSGGLRLNPNLYESGRVCLSLLNTWTGSDTEVWNPGSSTILQVLLSLQALVLNEKPYFNEAGFDKQIGRAEGTTNSVSYNENAFLVSCQSMLYTLRKPPKHFEPLVKEHFTRRAKFILSACNEYMEGAPVGFSLECGGNGHDENFKGSSTGFKIMLAKLLPKLVEAFSDQGIDCSQFH